MSSSSPSHPRYIEEDSSDEEPPSELERLQAMRDSLINKLYHKDKEIKELRESLELVQTRGEADAKEKKIIELAKKVRGLNLQLENYKNKAARAIEHALAVEKIGPAQETKGELKLPASEQTSAPGGPGGESVDELKKKVKDGEKRIAKLRNDNVALKTDYEKAVRALQKEVGESAASKIDEILKNPESGWKGRAQQINLLKAKLRQAPDMTHTSGFSTPMPEVKAEQNLGKLGSNKAKQIDQLSGELAATQHELKELKLKYSAAVSRRNTLEGEVKGLKTDYALKMKVLLEKTDNDDKLIKALKEELRGAGGGTGARASPVKRPGKSDADYSQILVENADLRNQRALLQDQLRAKEKEVQELFGEKVMSYGQPQPPQAKQPAPLPDSKELEALRAEVADLKLKLKRKPKEESDLMIRDLTKQNLNLRKKVDDLQQRVAKYEK